MNLSGKELAINGGSPIRTQGWKDNWSTGREEKAAVCRVLDSGYLSMFEGSHVPDPPFSFFGGPEVQNLEQEWCAYYEVNYAVSVNSATSGLYSAIGALELGYGDEVIVSPYTMTACAMAPLIYGAIPVFADVEEATGCLDASSIRACLTKRTKAILVVHQFGIPADMDEITKIARENNLKVIEDCAQAHGAMYKGRPVGTIGDIGVFSLNVNKTIQSGEGGVCTTNDKDVAYRLSLIRNHGEAVVGPAEYQNIVNIAGFNFRLTEIQAAIAREQLKKLNTLNKHRLELVEALSERLAKIPFLTTPSGRRDCLSTYYVYPLLFDENSAGVSRHAFVSAVNAEGALFYEGYVRPLYLQPVYQQKTLFKHGYPFSAIENKGSAADYREGLCATAEKLHNHRMLINEHIRFPHTLEDIRELAKCVEKVANNAP